ncbi:MAG: hypothetical protein ACI4TM_05465 [Candidatus Cryptobacteroides sp.]
MNCKAFFSIILFCTCIMASCCKFELDNAYAYDEEIKTLSDEVPTKVEEDCEFAFVRIGMYETIGNYTVTITGMRIECDNPEMEIPQFGENITSAETISSISSEPTFDMEDGEYSCVIPSGTSGNLTIRFDAMLRCEDNNATMLVEDASITIDASRTDWKSNRSYNYILRIDANTLGLRAITFNPEVSDYEDISING